MLYKNVSKRTIRVINVILKPGEKAEFNEGAAHVKTFLRMNWLTPVVAEAPAPVVVVEVPVVVVEAEAPTPEVTEAPPAVVVEETPALVVVEEAPAPEDGESKRGKGRKGKWQ